jgi:nucleolar protein 15
MIAEEPSTKDGSTKKSKKVVETQVETESAGNLPVSTVTRKSILKTSGSEKASIQSTKHNQNASKTTKKSAATGQPADSAAESEGSEADQEDAEPAEDSGDEFDGGVLLKGIDDDEEDSAEDVEIDIENTPALPNGEMVQAKLKAVKDRTNNDDERGTIYVGRIPHGFYEKQMRAFFSQFGDITRLRLSRNKKTGASKHFAFIEFANSEVAKIAAETMNSYLMFGHILKCSFVPTEQLHPEVWKGANKKYRIIPNTKLQGRQLAAPKSVDHWAKKSRAESRRRSKKAKDMAALGYELPNQFKTIALDQERIKEITQPSDQGKALGKDDDDAARQLLRENGESSILERSDEEGPEIAPATADKATSKKKEKVTAGPEVQAVQSLDKKTGVTSKQKKKRTKGTA